MEPAQQKRSRNWCFTLNNPENDDIPRTWPSVKYVVWQKEKGEAGTSHLQGYVIWASARTLSAVKDTNGQAHWGIREKPHEAARRYCMKEDTRVSGPWELGAPDEEKMGQGKRNDLMDIKKVIDTGASLQYLAENHFPVMAKHSRWIKEYIALRGKNKRNWPTFTTVIWGPTGTGKTRTVMEKAGPHAYWLKKPGHGQTVFFDNYDGEEDVVIDEFYGWLPYDLLLRMCDRYPLLVDTKGGSCYFSPKRIWITSNVKPQEWYPRAWTPAMDRRIEEPLGKVIHMTDDDRLERLAEMGIRLGNQEDNEDIVGSKRVRTCTLHPPPLPTLATDEVLTLSEDESEEEEESEE